VVFSEYSFSSTNKTDRHETTEILLKVALSTNHQPNQLEKVPLLSFFPQVFLKKTSTA
jgi:hypothetical protein